MHKAISGDGDIERVKLLVAAGAKLNVPNKEGITPVRLAALAGRSRKPVYDWLLAATGGKEPLPAVRDPTGQEAKRAIEGEGRLKGSGPHHRNDFGKSNRQIPGYEAKHLLWTGVEIPREIPTVRFVAVGFVAINLRRTKINLQLTTALAVRIDATPSRPSSCIPEQSRLYQAAFPDRVAKKLAKC